MYLQQLLEEENASKAKFFLNEIERKISLQFKISGDLGLVQGVAGQLLFLSQLDVPFDFINSKVEKLLSAITEEKDLNGALVKGLSGIGFVLKIVNEKFSILDDDFFKKLYGYVRKFAKFDIVRSNYDLLYGYIGECLFLLEEKNNNKSLKIFSSAIENLSRISYKNKYGISWINPIDLWRFYPNADQLKELPDCCNLGVAHGSPGIIFVLSKLSIQYPELRLNGLIDEALEFLIHQESEEDYVQNGFYYRGYSGDAGKINRGHLLAWCYSDLGISIIYFKLWEITGKIEFYNRANKIATKCSQRNIEDTPINSSGLCHGVAGIAHMFNKIFKITNQLDYKNAANYWFSILFKICLRSDSKNQYITFLTSDDHEPKYTDDNGFLEGLSGIGLAIHAAISNTSPSWDKVLLL